MSDGALAALTIALGLLDAGQNHCSTGCFAPSEAEGRLSFSVGQASVDGADVGTEVYFRRTIGRDYGPFGVAYGLSATEDGAFWAGIGPLYEIPIGEAFYAELHLMPGIYVQGDGPDLGGPLEFRSGIEIGYEANGVRYGLSYDHRSNNEFYDTNPGLETLQFRVSISR